MATKRVNPNVLVHLNIPKLIAIQKAFDNSRMVTQVGILGQKVARKEAGGEKASGGHRVGKQASVQTNAELGLIHEKGSLSRGIPRRSFLLMPLEQKALDLGKAREALMQMFAVGSEGMVSCYQKLGIAAENIIQKAFATGGFGKWKPLSQMTIDRKKSSAILIDTAQLRKSISSRVKSR